MAYASSKPSPAGIPASPPPQFPTGRCPGNQLRPPGGRAAWGPENLVVEGGGKVEGEPGRVGENWPAPPVPVRLGEQENLGEEEAGVPGCLKMKS